MKCDICGEGETSLVCSIENGLLNYAEVVLLNATPIYEDIPAYYMECNVCGLVSVGKMECKVNTVIYTTLRREHGLSDKAINRKARY